MSVEPAHQQSSDLPTGPATGLDLGIEDSLSLYFEESDAHRVSPECKNASSAAARMPEMTGPNAF
jgi:hypothetical protein